MDASVVGPDVMGSVIVMQLLRFLLPVDIGSGKGIVTTAVPYAGSIRVPI